MKIFQLTRSPCFDGESNWIYRLWIGEKKPGSEHKEISYDLSETQALNTAVKYADLFERGVEIQFSSSKFNWGDKIKLKKKKAWK